MTHLIFHTENVQLSLAPSFGMLFHQNEKRQQFYSWILQQCFPDFICSGLILKSLVGKVFFVTFFSSFLKLNVLNLIMTNKL